MIPLHLALFRVLYKYKDYLNFVQNKNFQDQFKIFFHKYFDVTFLSQEIFLMSLRKLVSEKYNISLFQLPLLKTE